MTVNQASFTKSPPGLEIRLIRLRSPPNRLKIHTADYEVFILKATSFNCREVRKCDTWIIRLLLVSNRLKIGTPEAKQSRKGDISRRWILSAPHRPNIHLVDYEVFI